MNGPTHRLVAGATVGLFLAYKEGEEGITTAKPILGGVAAAFLTSLPDLIEPATSPNHRKFFHSMAFAAALGLTLNQLRQWDAESDMEKLLKQLVLIGGAAYLIHLALDFTTPKSLPLF